MTPQKNGTTGCYATTAASLGGPHDRHCITVSLSAAIKREVLLVARKTVLVSDQSGREIPEGKGAKVRITFNDARKGARELDLLDEEAEALGGRSVARRGRRPRSSPAQ